MLIDTIEKLREIYKHPSERALKKDIGRLDKHARHFIEKSPFCVISTMGKSGQMDVSPRGGGKGFVRVTDDHTLWLPDSRGNNRLDCLTNIIETSRIGMLFLIPGIEETLRINGSARITTDPSVLGQFENHEFKCVSVMEVQVEEVFMHCAKALMRSRLWDPSVQITGDQFPSMGEILKDQMGLDTPAESRKEAKQRYLSEL